MPADNLVAKGRCPSDRARWHGRYERVERVGADARMVCDGLEGGAAPKGASDRVYVSVDTNRLNKPRERTQQRSVSLPNGFRNRVGFGNTHVGSDRSESG